MGFNGPQSEELARRSSQNLQAVSQASSVLARGAQEVSREVIQLVQDRLQKNVDGLNRLAGTRSVQDFVAVQSDLARDGLQQVIDTNKRIAELSVRVADGNCSGRSDRLAHAVIGNGVPWSVRRIASMARMALRRAVSTTDRISA